MVQQVFLKAKDVEQIYPTVRFFFGLII